MLIYAYNILYILIVLSSLSTIHTLTYIYHTIWNIYHYSIIYTTILEYIKYTL